ncbi:MAG: ArsA family ATPase [Wenzhouxiangella sp.]
MSTTTLEYRLGVAFDRRFLFITGKGGVGKTLISAALAVRAAERGERTLWVEMSEAPRGGHLFADFKPQYQLVPVRDHLWAMNLRVQPAIEEYLAVAFKLPFITRLIARNSLFQVLTGALPGLDSLIPLGKIWYELGRKRGRKPYWDRIILDAPATGHALAMLRFPEAALDMVKSGNVADRSREISEILSDRELTSLITVTTLEELPLDETREMVSAVHTETSYRFAAIVCNSVLPDIAGASGSEQEVQRFADYLAGSPAPDLAAEAGQDIASMRTRLAWLEARRQAQQARIEALASLGVPMLRAPWIPRATEADVLEALVEEFAAA